MDRLASPPSHSQDNSDEPLTPQRSPSRLDFCMEVGDDSPMHRPDWSCPPYCENSPYTLVNEEGPFSLEIAPLAHPQRLIVEHPPPPLFAQHGPEEDIVIKPIPVRLPTVQVPADAQEPMPPANTTPKRLDYPHHGFSHSALLQQKALWYSRFEEWVEWQSRMEQSETHKQVSNTNSAYTGIATHSRMVSPPPYMRAPPSGLERDQPPMRYTKNVQAPIFPRVGDISALRDPYPVNIDRSFFMFPLWTLQKALFSFNLQRRSESFASSAPAYRATPVQASTSTSSLSSYSSSTSTDDDDESDSTLVADDSPVPKSHLPPEHLQTISSPYGSPPSRDDFSGWEFSWYTRWQVLLGIFRRDHPRHDAFGYPLKSAVPPSLSPPDCTVGEGQGDNGDDEDDNYGQPVVDSTFNEDFDEECNRALAFYNREVRQEVAW